MKKLLPLILLVTLILACDGQIDQKFEPEADIFALLSVRDTSVDDGLGKYQWQWVKIDQSYDIKDSVSTWGLRGASAKLYYFPDPNSYVDLIDSFFDQDSLKWYKYDHEGWYGGFVPITDYDEYTLNIVLPWGDTVTGKSMLPSPVYISWPKDGDTLSISKELANPHPITWNNSHNVGLYTLQCVPNVDTSKYDSFPPFLFIPSFSNDTSYQFFLERAVVPWVYNQEYIVRVNAYGTEYASYIKLGLSGGKANLVTQTGDTCFGVFSGIAIDSVRVYLIE